MSEQSLADVLSGAEVVETEVPTVDNTETEAAPAESSKPDKAHESASEGTTPTKAEPEQENWTKKAVLDERRKRQELERKLAEIESKANQPKRPDLFEDPDGALGHLQGQLQTEMQRMRLELSQEAMRDRFDDYDELESEFIELAQENPVLLKELAEARNPAKYAYDTAKKARDAAELKDVDKVRAKLRAEIEAQVRKEFEDKQAKLQGKREALTPSLAASQSKGEIDPPEDDSLEAILKSRNRKR